METHLRKFEEVWEQEIVRITSVVKDPALVRRLRDDASGAIGGARAAAGSAAAAYSRVEAQAKGSLASLPPKPTGSRVASLVSSGGGAPRSDPPRALGETDGIALLERAEARIAWHSIA